MQQSKAADPAGSKPKPQIFISKQSDRSPKPQTLKQYTPNPKTYYLNPHPWTLHPKPLNLNSSKPSVTQTPNPKP